MASTFPSVDLVPKKETNVLDFLKEHPEYNGKNVLIGILDTGVDPGASGLATMSDGVTPKLLDIVDCTGSGDVNVSSKKQVEDPGDDVDYYLVQALSGKTIKLKKSWWKTTTGAEGDHPVTENIPVTSPPTVRFGLKLAYELFPQSVTNRVKKHRQMLLDKELQSILASVRSQLSELAGKKSAEDIKQREELQARIDVLTDKEWGSENDPGYILDCIVFFDGQDLRALVGVADEDQEMMDWTSKSPLAAFHKERQYDTVSSVDQYNFGVNFYDDADVLSIVGDCTPHGTHVAAIAAASEGERSGVAPGAQVVSIKIGDSRMGSMESGSSLARGIMAAVRLGCDVINLSYGEASQVANSGRIIQMAEELVWRHNIIFVSATGNNGPALTTVNAPGGIASSIIGVGAYVSPDMMKADYSMESNSNVQGSLVGTTFTWSSVGPALDGDNGVCVCAPGGAITSVSNWTLQKSMLMNGTSMASPHACGCVALLLSACKAENIPISSSRIRRAIENTAKGMPNLSCLQQGWGLLQVDKAFDHLKSLKDEPTEDVHFEIYLEGKAGNPRGIYLRQAEESASMETFSVRVNPQFRRTDNLDDETQKLRIGFEMKFALESTEPSWVSVASHFMLMNNGRSFKINLDGSKLSPGVHTAKVLGRDADRPERGVIWSLPITIIKPLEEQRHISLSNQSVSYCSLASAYCPPLYNACLTTSIVLQFEATEIKRFFVTPPAGATWMDITVRDKRDVSEEATSRLYVLHAVQLLPHSAYRDNAQQKYLSLLPSQTSVSSIPVESNVTCEVAIGRYWSAAGSTIADISIEFRGVLPTPQSIAFSTGDAFALVALQSCLKDETINPVAKLTKWRTPVRPKTEGLISPLGSRDIQPWSDKKTYQLVLTYEFSQDDKGTFTPRAMPLQEVLYESTYESQLILAYDGDKKYLGYCDAYANPITAPKGTVVIKLQVRHDDPAMLEKLKDMTLWIERSLDKDISLTAYSTREDLLVGGKRSMKKRTLRKGSMASVFFAEPSSSKISSTIKAGDILTGSCTFESGENSLPGEGKRPGGYAISYVVGPKMDKPPSEPEVAEIKDERTPEERIHDAIRDLKVGQLDKLSKEEVDGGKFEELYSEMIKEYPDHVPLMMANLKHLDGRSTRKESLKDIIESAEQILSQIPADEIALYFGKKHDKEDPTKVKMNKDMEKRKGYLVDAIVRKALAHADSREENAPARFDSALNDLKQWVDIDSNGKYALLALERDTRAGHFGLALKRIMKLLSKNGKDTGGVKPLNKSDLLERRATILQQVGYTSLHKRDKAFKFVASPADYKVF